VLPNRLQDTQIFEKHQIAITTPFLNISWQNMQKQCLNCTVRGIFFDLADMGGVVN